VHECTHIDGGAASAAVGPHQSVQHRQDRNPAIGQNSAESSSPTTGSAAPASKQPALACPQPRSPKS
jgi:hypothetical protein